MELVDLKSNMFTLILVGTMSLKLLFRIFFMSNVFYEFFFLLLLGHQQTSSFLISWFVYLDVTAPSLSTRFSFITLILKILSS